MGTLTFSDIEALKEIVIGQPYTVKPRLAPEMAKLSRTNHVRHNGSVLPVQVEPKDSSERDRIQTPSFLFGMCPCPRAPAQEG